MSRARFGLAAGLLVAIWAAGWTSGQEMGPIVGWRPQAADFLAPNVLVLAASPAPIYVDDDAPPGGDGGSWQSAFRFLQDALLLAVPPAEIRVAQGIYKPDCNAAHPAGTGNRAATFQLRSGVALRGGYAGLGAADPDAWDIALYVSILSGDLLGNDGPNFANYGENSYHVVTGDGTDAAAICEGLTIEAGNTPSAPEDGYEGGGIRIAAGAPTIQVCTIRRNMATLGGGVYAGRGADPTITACTISENTARSGAGVYCGGGAATIAGCSVSGNSVTGTGDAYGGGLYFRGGATGSVTDCSITGNRATAGASRSAVGAGICVWDSYAALLIARCTIADNRAESLYAAEGGGAEFFGWATVDDCTITGNTASGLTSGSAWGGGASLYDATLNNCLVSDNRAEGRWASGGGVACVQGPSVVGCTVVGNTVATEDPMRACGGGVYLNCPFWAHVTDCVIGGNGGTATCGYGGGVYCDRYNYNYYAEFYLTRVWITGNHALYGGGLATDAADAYLENCTVAGNSAERGGAIYLNDSYAELGNVILCGNSAATYGGGFYLVDNVTHAVNCSLRGNSAPAGAALVLDSAPAPWWEVDNHFANCIFWNGGDEVRDLNSSGVEVVRSDVAGGWGIANLHYDPGWLTVPGGVWREDAFYDATTHTITFTDAAAAWIPNEHVGRLLNPDTAQPLTLIVSANGGTSVSVLADWATIAATASNVVAGTAYELLDFHLTPESICVDAGGYADHLPAEDFEGDPRPLQCSVDIGVDESPYFGDCNGNGQCDHIDISSGSSNDCNGDGLPDECDLALGMSADLNGNAIPDECEPDCNGNDIPDDLDIAAGTSIDCSGNGIPDECEPDCNHNGLADSCDIAAGTSIDCTGNGVPDECEADCNHNGVADSCDIATGFSHDLNHDGIPDECRVGDMNCDGQFGQASFGDINPFVQYLSDISAWQATYPYCPPENGDINGDGTYGQGSFGDINPFVNLLLHGG